MAASWRSLMALEGLAVVVLVTFVLSDHDFQGCACCCWAFAKRGSQLVMLPVFELEPKSGNNMNTKELYHVLNSDSFLWRELWGPTQTGKRGQPHVLC